MIFSIIVRKKYLYGAFKFIFSPETFSTSLRHTGDNLERRFRRHLGGRGLSREIKLRKLGPTEYRNAAKIPKSNKKHRNAGQNHQNAVVFAILIRFYEGKTNLFN